MGVRGLIGALRRICRGDELREVTVKEMQGETIAVDAMNLLFYMAARGPLEEEIDRFCRHLRVNEMRAACVFDSSRLSPERRQRATVRRRQRHDALSELARLEEAHGPVVPFYARRRQTMLRSRTVKVAPEAVRAAQTQMANSGVCTVWMAPDEADGICVDLVKSGAAYACLSNDSDMFVRGCPRVLREYKSVDGAFEIWDFASMLGTLGMEGEAFAGICSAASAAGHTHDQLHTALTAGGGR